MEIFKLFGSVFVKTEDAEKSISRTGEKAESFAAKLGKGISTTAKWSGAIVTGAAAAATGLTKFAESSAATADKIDKMSQKIGISREAYQELDFVCSQSGTSVDGLAAGMKKLTSALAGTQESAEEIKEELAELDAEYQSGKISLEEYEERYEEISSSVEDAKGEFEKLGLSMEQLQAMSPEDALFATIEALQKMPNDANRAAIAQKLLGKSAQELAPLFNSGAGSLESMRQQAHELGLVLDDEMIDSGVSLTDTMDQLRRSFGAVVTQLGGALMPVVQDVASFLLSYMPTIQQLFMTLAPVIMRLLEGILPPLLELAGAIFPVLVELINSLLPPLISIAQVVLPVLVNLLEPLLPLLKMAAGLLSPLVEIVVAFLQPLTILIDSLLQPIINMLSSLAGTVSEVVAPALKKISEVIKTVLNPAFSDIRGVLKPVLDFVSSAFKAAYETVSGVVTKLVSSIRTAFDGIRDKVTTAVTVVRDVMKNVFGSISGIVKAPVNGLITIINKMIGALNQLSFDVPDWVPIIGGESFGFHLKEVPLLERGGVLKKGQMGFIEGNGAEAVVPLDQNKKWISAVADDLGRETGDFSMWNRVIELLTEIICLLQPDAVNEKVLPIYIGGDRLIDELLVEAKGNIKVRSGGWSDA